ncbi:hypothetical protein ACFL5W_02415 [Thermodesulfobacteriota bacterium]
MEKAQKFIDEWKEDTLGTKPIFLSFCNDIFKYDKTKFEFYERPGVSYSLRGIHMNQKDRPLFVMIDVIDDNPRQRWLSVCFYGDMIKDPDELGDLIPEGLLGSDGYCFDITEPDVYVKKYVSKRIHEAYEKAGINMEI